MSSLGIYFGPKAISIVETQGKKVLNHTRIPLTVATAELEEGVPEELKMVALLKEELRRNKIEAKEAAIALAGRDLVIRTFEMPILPARELQSAVNFEAKKYIPFKVEDLVADFQVKLDRVKQKNLTLYAGIKKEALDKHISILSQLNIKASALEYAGFSVLRLLKLAGLNDKGIIAVLNTDLQEEDEINFTVLEDGFPLFSRDITLVSETEGPATPEELESGMLSEKLKTEIRISLDYYHRKFPSKNIEKAYLISTQDSRLDLEAFIKELGLSTQFIDVSQFIGKPISLSLGFIKGYSVSLSKIIKTDLKINLLAAKARIRPVREITARLPIKIPISMDLFKGLKVKPRIVVLGLFICLATFLFGLYRKVPLQKETEGILISRPRVSTVNSELGYEQLNKVNADYNRKIKALDNKIKKRLYLTELLDLIPRILPERVWLEEFSFKSGPQESEGKAELILKGIAYLEDSNREIEAINNFFSNLKKSPGFAKYFKEINITTLNREAFKGTSITRFTISAQSYPERE